MFVIQFPPEADQPLAEASERVSGLTSERVNQLDVLTGEPANSLTGTPGQANRQTNNETV